MAKKKKTVRPRGIEPGEIKRTKAVQFKKTKRKPSSYMPLFWKMRRLTCGKSFTIPVPRGVATQTFHNRLTAAFRRYDRYHGKPPRGCQFRKRTTADGKICVYCQRKPK